MAFTKTVKEVEYNVEITKSLLVQPWMISEMRNALIVGGLPDGVKALRGSFMDHYGERMFLRDAKDIAEDYIREHGIKPGQGWDKNPSLKEYHGEGPSLGDILKDALKSHNNS